MNKRPFLFALAAACIAAPTAHAASADWRQDAKPGDIQRIERVQDAWRDALKQARKVGYARQIAAQGDMLNPAKALSLRPPGPGAYRCRMFKLGGMADFVAYGWFKCQVELTPGGDLILRKLTGSQRLTGNLYPDGDRRQAFLGGEAWGDEAPVLYGQDPARDQAGLLERIGPTRWRLALPYPKQESTLNVLELRR